VGGGGSITVLRRWAGGVGAVGLAGGVLGWA
jgi:hypothetical protein